MKQLYGIFIVETKLGVHFLTILFPYLESYWTPHWGANLKIFTNYLKKLWTKIKNYIKEVPNNTSVIKLFTHLLNNKYSIKYKIPPDIFAQCLMGYFYTTLIFFCLNFSVWMSVLTRTRLIYIQGFQKYLTSSWLALQSVFICTSWMRS